MKGIKLEESTIDNSKILSDSNKRTDKSDLHDKIYKKI